MIDGRRDHHRALPCIVLDDALAAACPEGVDVYFDNTAGAISDAVVKRLRVGARIVVCGTASVAIVDDPNQAVGIFHTVGIRHADAFVEQEPVAGGTGRFSRRKSSSGR